MDIVDAQLHLGLQPTAQDLLAQMDVLGIRSVVFDEFWGRNARDQGIPNVEFADGGYRPLSPTAQAAALLYPQRCAYIQRVTRGDPQLDAWIPILASSPGCVSLRLVVLARAERDAFAAGAHDTVLRLAQAHGLPVSILGSEPAQFARCAGRDFPDLKLVVDHCGWVRNDQEWRAVLDLARYPNMFLKWSHASRAFERAGEGPARMQAALVEAVAAFGAQRVLWASDATHDEAGTGWPDSLAFVRQHPGLSETDKAWVLGGTARRLYRWPATPD